MKTFMDKDFLLQTETAKKLYNDYAATTPILDYHCHINPQEIYEDRQFENITQVWLGGDHYKWRFMRSCGVDERFITGDASDKEKFLKWAEVLGKAIGNPLFHWSHLELQKYFGYHGVLNKNTAEEVWELCNKRLAQPDMTVRNIIKQSNVTLICTTDDPVDSLEWHKKIAEDASFDVKVLPAWRPDKAMNIEKPTYPEYLDQLSTVSGIKVASFADLCKALSNRMDFFASMGCCVSDHALEYVMYAPAHRTCPTVLIKPEGTPEDGVVIVKDCNKVELGSLETANHRTICKYILPGQVESCQLEMGMTKLEPGSVWNTMPCHTHDRRMEVYLYFDMPEDALVMHYMGEPTETRHIVMRNEQAVISPSWSIHSGCGTQAYTFIWGMVGENQDFDDMDDVAMTDLL